MKVDMQELREMLELKDVIFDESFFEYKKIDRAPICKYFFSSNSSETITRTYNDGLMKDFAVKGLKLNKNDKEKRAFCCTRIAKYIMLKDHDEAHSADMQTLFIYEVGMGKQHTRNAREIYVACQTNIKFPTLILNKGEEGKELISLFPYISKIYLYGATDVLELKEMMPQEQDCIYTNNAEKVGNHLLNASSFVLENKNLSTARHLHIDDGIAIYSINKDNIQKMRTFIA